MSHHFSRTLIAAMLVFAVSFAWAAGADSAKGKLVVQGDDKPLSMELNHAYFITGPDEFDAAKTTRRVLFTGEDVRSAIEACEDAGCAMYSFSEGMWLQIDDSSTMRWWGKVKPVQQSRMLDRSALVLTTDTPDRLAGTLTLDSSGKPVKISFDAPLVKAFSAVK